MMCLLRVCALLFMVVSCNAECFIQKPEVDLLSPENNLKGCVDSDGKTHDFNSEWNKDCYNCVCKQDGIQCCNMIPTIKPPDECKMVVEKETCSFRFVLVLDESKPCLFA